MVIRAFHYNTGVGKVIQSIYFFFSLFSFIFAIRCRVEPVERYSVGSDTRFLNGNPRGSFFYIFLFPASTILVELTKILFVNTFAT